jgi:NitT/TauT family transport system substrate-binding protein
MRRKTPVLTLLAVFAVLAAACGGAGADDGGAGDEGDRPALRLGYFPNVTHAPAVYGVEERLFEDALGDAADLEPHTFSTGTEVISAIFSGALDASYIGPNPAISAHAQSSGDAIRIIAGATSGGAKLVVREGIESADDLAGARLASPSLGNTQDVALRAWLADQGYHTELEGGGDVSIVPQENAQTLETFRAGDIDGAWVPEPWATRLELEGGGQVLLDERELWPDGQFVTTHLIVATRFLEEHPGVVERLLAAHVDAVEAVNGDPDSAQQRVNDGIEAVTGKALAPETIAGAWDSMTFILDPIATSLHESAADAQEVGLLEPVDLDGIYDLDLLNTILRDRGSQEVVGR